ncbi:hypothetical protein Ndes2437B_g06442 [Nannochloris sp. 'desiccata']
MPPKLEELLQLKIHQLHEELGEMTRPQLQALAKKCGLKANQRTLELTGCLVEYIIKEKRAKGGATGTPYTRGGKEWHLTKSKELAELEAALKTMPPPQQTLRRGRLPSATPSLAGAGAPVTGKKRKHDDSTVTPAEHPPAKRHPSTTPYANTLELSRAILRRPGQSKPTVPSRLGRTSTPAAVPATQNKERLNTQALPSSATRSTKKVKFSPAPQKAASPMTIEAASSNKNRGQNTPFGSRNVVDTATPNGLVARKPTLRANSSAKSRTRGGTASNRSGGGNKSSSSSSLRVAAAIRATKAHEAYIARMRKAQK